MLRIKRLDCVRNVQIYEMTSTQPEAASHQHCNVNCTFLDTVLRMPEDEVHRFFFLPIEKENDNSNMFCKFQLHTMQIIFQNGDLNVKK